MLSCSRRQRNFYGAYGILTEFMRNSNGETATAGRQRNGTWKPGVTLRPVSTWMVTVYGRVNHLGMYEPPPTEVDSAFSLLRKMSISFRA